ncbi:MAG: nitroreductase family protein [Metallibacterium scheffleri]|jgi:nitroreductase|uniref:nitroreductase family protein n=1 Tax=Metallibacterium scheffleri TaxID=993689 RepID=UPI0026F206C0|nr:nitroreductase family protein [Metallibacterium scheffleri]MCK9368310.1 nitroreductase family protein [Metallibacterium scheffleri]
MDVRPPETLALPAPRTSGGLPLMAALGRRHSTREYSARDLSPQVLSDLLWAADGINRTATGGRTAPSAKNWGEIDVYVARVDGLHLYQPASHDLRQVLTLDLRAATGVQDFVGTAPLNLIYVADLTRVESAKPVERRFYGAADAAFIAQNVYLFCASEGLATVVRGLINRRDLAQAMQLARTQRVILAQTVGYPP